MEPQADQEEGFFPSIDVNAESWRYQSISQEPRFGKRPPDWILGEDCVIAKILDSWTFGVVMDFGGASHSESSPKVFAICTNPEKYRCNPKGCDSGCLERFWASVSHGGVLGKKDLLRIYFGSGPHGLFDPLNFHRDQILAKEFFDMIEMIEEDNARQKNC
jgi:hypothetical protein